MRIELRKAGFDAGQIAAAIEAKLPIKLHADKPTDTVHGSETQFGDTVIIELYEKDEKPTAERKSTLKAHGLTKKQIEQIKEIVKSL